MSAILNSPVLPAMEPETSEESRNFFNATVENSRGLPEDSSTIFPFNVNNTGGCCAKASKHHVVRIILKRIRNDNFIRVYKPGKCKDSLSKQELNDPELYQRFND